MFSFIACLILANSAFARSIPYDIDTNNKVNFLLIDIPVIICIVVVVTIVVIGGYCLIHYTKKHRKSPSEECLTKPTPSDLSIPSNTTPESSNSEVRELTRNVVEQDICI